MKSSVLRYKELFGTLQLQERLAEFLQFPAPMMIRDKERLPPCEKQTFFTYLDAGKLTNHVKIYEPYGGSKCRKDLVIAAQELLQTMDAHFLRNNQIDTVLFYLWDCQKVPFAFFRCYALDRDPQTAAICMDSLLTKLESEIEEREKQMAVQRKMKIGYGVLLLFSAAALSSV